jgi:hypothetical protein
MQWDLWCLFGTDLFPSVTYSSWNKRLRRRSSSCALLIPWMDLYTVLGGDSGFVSRYLSLAWTESLGKPYLHVGRLGAVPIWLIATPLLWGLVGEKLGRGITFEMQINKINNKKFKKKSLNRIAKSHHHHNCGETYFLFN